MIPQDPLLSRLPIVYSSRLLRISDHQASSSAIAFSPLKCRHLTSANEKHDTRTLKRTARQDSLLAACVTDNFNRFKPWLDSNMRFFPDFTDHSCDHVARVLALAEVLVQSGLTASTQPNAWQVLTPADVACLVLAVLLHDSAMHLSPDSFIAIVKHGALNDAENALDTGQWPSLWFDFLCEAHRWDNHQRARILGRFRNHFRGTEHLQASELDPGAITDTDCLIIGEFIRRHHARLAFEFSAVGVPGANGRFLTMTCPESFDELSMLAGLVARATALIREAISVFDMPSLSSFQVRVSWCPHSILDDSPSRTADYLDLYAERAPRQILMTRRLNSRYSSGEWDAHAAISDIRFANFDPEAVTVDAQSSKCRAILRIRKWLSGLQFEFDRSWAVLGEVYREHHRYSQLGLSVQWGPIQLAIAARIKCRASSIHHDACTV